MKSKLLAAMVVLSLHILGSRTNAQESHKLTNADIVNLVQRGWKSDQLVGLINTNPHFFDSSPKAMAQLYGAGVPPAVLDAMFPKPQQTPVPTPARQPSQTVELPPASNSQAGSTSTSLQPQVEPKTNQNPPASTTNNPGPPSGSGPGRPVPPNSEYRFQAAKSTTIPSDAFPAAPQSSVNCPQPNKGRLHTIDLYWDSGGSSASRLSASGTYCFLLHDANPLYSWSFNASELEPNGNPLQLLQDTVQSLSNITFGTSSAKGTTGTKGATTAQPTPALACPVTLANVTQTATALREALAAMAPTADSASKYSYIPYGKTASSWRSATADFADFSLAVKVMIGSLQPLNWDAPGCDDIFAQAESVVLTDFPTLRQQVRALADILNQAPIAPFEYTADEWAPMTVKISPQYGGATTTAAEKTFTFAANYGILTSSAGFLTTELSTRSYTSATAPNPGGSASTQNVLRVDYGSRLRPALVVLLNGNLPKLNTHNWGLSFSAGPVFDIANGKADTSHFGLFAGPSIRLTPYIYITAGEHIGEFADFPTGFSYPGQTIPANTGTPTPTKRYTARFAFAITFKFRDLASGTGSGAGQQTGAEGAKPSTTSSVK
jgi:hypothetical protein